MCSFMALILFSKVVNDIVIVNQSIITSLHNDVELWVKPTLESKSTKWFCDLVYKWRVNKHRYFEELNLKVCGQERDKWDPWSTAA